MVMVKDRSCEPHKVTEFLRQYIPDLVIGTNIGSELSYCLEEKYSAVFEEMFNSIEENRQDLRILSYGVSLTTMEEVFMKVGSEMETKAIEDGLEEIPLANGNGVAIDMKSAPLLTSWRLAQNQILAMFTKYVMATIRSWLLYVIVILIPIIDLTISILVTKSLQGSDDLPLRVLDLHVGI